MHQDAVNMMQVMFSHSNILEFYQSWAVKVCKVSKIEINVIGFRQVSLR